MLPECLTGSEGKGRGGLERKEEGLHDVSAHRLWRTHTVRGEEETAGRWHSSSTQRVNLKPQLELQGPGSAKNTPCSLIGLRDHEREVSCSRLTEQFHVWKMR